MATCGFNRLRRARLWRLDALESLPCGCVDSAYCSQSVAVMLIALEAKGPHCPIPAHIAGEVLGLESLAEVDLGESASWSRQSRCSTEEES